MIKTRKNYSAKQLMLINEMAQTMRRLFAAYAAENEADAQTGEKWQSLAYSQKRTVLLKTVRAGASQWCIRPSAVVKANN